MTESATATDWSYLEEMTQGAVVIDHQYRYLYINEQAAKEMHVPKASLLGKTIMEIYPHAAEQELFGEFKKTLVGRVITQTQMPFRFEDGTVRWYEIRMEPIPEGVLIISLDITKLKELEADTGKGNA